MDAPTIPKMQVNHESRSLLEPTQEVLQRTEQRQSHCTRAIHHTKRCRVGSTTWRPTSRPQTKTDELQLVNDELRLCNRMPITYNPYTNHKFVLRNCPDVQIEWSDYAKLCSVYRVTFDDYKPSTYIYNFREPMQHDRDFDRFDQGPRI